METYQWYQELIKPSFAPPAAIFGPVWTVLYAIIVLSFGYTVRLFVKKEIPFQTLLPFVINSIANLAFSPIQFGLQNNLLAAIDIVIVLVSIVWFMIAIYPKARWVVFVNIPYLLWVSFATVLQFSITVLNW